MAKRFTDTDKWKKNSFSELSAKMKLVWVYLCDTCDHAGIWEANFRLLSFQLGYEVTSDEVEKSFGDKIQWLSHSKIFIPSFVEFQYGELNPENRAHRSVITKLEKEGASKGLASPFQGAKDKEKDKDKDKDKDKEGGVGETITQTLPELLDDLTAPFLAKVKPEVQAAWVKTYEDRSWIKSELKKAVAWIHSNPKRAPKSDYARFLNNWLSTGWEKHRKTIGPGATALNRYGKPEPRPVHYPPVEAVISEMHDQEPRGSVDVAALVSQAFGYHPKKGSA